MLLRLSFTRAATALEFSPIGIIATAIATRIRKGVPPGEIAMFVHASHARQVVFKVPRSRDGDAVSHVVSVA